MNAFVKVTNFLSALVNKIHVSFSAMSLGEHPGRDFISYSVGYDFFAYFTKIGQLRDTVSQWDMVGNTKYLRFR